MSQNINFEEAFQRLEAILDKMNSGGVSLDDSLKLYEEADSLISSCMHKLNEATGKIEMLIKKREGEIEFVQDKPQTVPFQA